MTTLQPKLLQTIKAKLGALTADGPAQTKSGSLDHLMDDFRQAVRAGFTKIEIWKVIKKVGYRGSYNYFSRKLDRYGITRRVARAHLLVSAPEPDNRPPAVLPVNTANLAPPSERRERSTKTREASAIWTMPSSPPPPVTRGIGWRLRRRLASQRAAAMAANAAREKNEEEERKRAAKVFAFEPGTDFQARRNDISNE